MPEGLLGFPDDHRYAILHKEGDQPPFQWLQSLDTPELAFVVVDPRLFEPSYRLEFDEETVALFGSIVPEDIQPIVILNVPTTAPGNITANMRAPVILHLTRRLGRQIILENESYLIMHPLVPKPTDVMPEQNPLI